MDTCGEVSDAALRWSFDFYNLKVKQNINALVNPVSLQKRELRSHSTTEIHCTMLQII